MKNTIIFLSFFLILFKAQADSYGIIGDAGDWNSRSKRARDSMLKAGVKQLIMPGDNIYDTKLTYDSIWKNWSDAGFDFTLVAIGNHNRSHAEEVAFFKLENAYYSKVIGPARFIVLNSDSQKTANAQASFLKTNLEEATEAFIFVVYHHPPFDLLHKWAERALFHLATRPILLANSKKITALLVGHDHVASYNEMNDLPVIVSGAIMSTYDIKPVDTTEDGRKIKTKWSSVMNQYYWTKLDVDGNTGEAWINFVKTDVDKSMCSIRLMPRPVTLLDNCK